jgi:creatinine amidohydrolase
MGALRAAGVKGRRRMEWGSMTSPEVAECLPARPVVILPVGATEQHGPHLPLDTDTASVVEVARRVAEAAGNTLVLPAIPYGFSSAHAGFPGTVTLPGATLLTLVRDVCQSLVSQGVRRILLLSGHNANRPVLEIVARELSTGDVRVAAANYFDFARDTFQAIRRSPLGGAAHAGEFETSLQLYLRPEAVRPGRPVPNPASVDMFGWSPVVLGSDYRQSTPAGVKGDPTVASADTGAATVEAVVQAIAAFVASFREAGR